VNFGSDVEPLAARINRLLPLLKEADPLLYSEAASYITGITLICHDRRAVGSFEASVSQ
jgi:hypothetical protein